MRFSFQANPSRVVFGAGALHQLPAEIERLGASRALVLCTPGQHAMGEQVAALLGSRAAGVCAQAVMHVPMEA
ncbi:MAG: iron-containing alcohol dehydrogenase, partial [Rubrivivax sp.]